MKIFRSRLAVLALGALATFYFELPINKEKKA